MTDPKWYAMMAAYNRWANEGIYDVCASIPDDIRRKDCDVFYKSIHGTLNHLVHGDQMWLARFNGQPVGNHPFGEDLYAEFDQLREVRGAMDAEIITWVAGLTGEWLQEQFSFTSRAYEITISQSAWIMVSHMFNHQTHHRGQLSVLISQLGFESPPLDLLVMPELSSL